MSWAQRSSTFATVLKPQMARYGNISAYRTVTHIAARRYATSQPAATPVEDDRMIGPYPVVPREHYNRRPQDIKWDDQQGRRNLGEPLHYQFDMIDVWSPDKLGDRPDSTASRWNLYFIGIILGFSSLCYWKFDGPNFVRREYPHGGLYKALGGTDETKEVFQAREDRS